MKAVMCVCGHQCTGADAEELVQALSAHSAERHADLQLTEANRRDYVQAALRSGGWDGERVPLPAPPEIRPLTPERRADFLAFFEGEAFADNPAWASCYCYFYQFPGTADV